MSNPPFYIDLVTGWGITIKQINDFLILLKPMLETIYFLSGIGLLMSIIIGLNQVKLVKKDMNDRNTRVAVEMSLKYLDFFATSFIPANTKYRDSFGKEVPNPEKTDHLFDGKFTLDFKKLSKELVAECIVKQELGVVTLINQLEYFSVGILNKLADEDIVFTPISLYFIQFIEREHLLISILRGQGAPYKNMMKLYIKWKDRLEVEKYELQKKDAEHKIKQKGEGYKSSPPLGL